MSKTDSVAKRNGNVYYIFMVNDIDINLRQNCTCSSVTREAFISLRS